MPWSRSGLLPHRLLGVPVVTEQYTHRKDCIGMTIWTCGPCGNLGLPAEPGGGGPCAPRRPFVCRSPPRGSAHRAPTHGAGGLSVRARHPGPHPPATHAIRQALQGTGTTKATDYGATVATTTGVPRRGPQKHPMSVSTHQPPTPSTGGGGCVRGVCGCG